MRIYTLFFCIALTTFSCGPRSGIHEDNNNSDQIIDEVSEKQWCGNAVMDSQNYDWAIKELKIDGDGNHGQKLFKQNCAVCHSLNYKGPEAAGLDGFYQRIPDPKTEWFKNYILSSTKVYKSGDSYAKKLRTQYPKERMTEFEGLLSDQDINDIMIYVVGNTK
ncbi:MAG: cytochrome c [Bacteroidetes bacterium]|nr:cytochrome c [Bacteroidota bacterium]